MGRFVVTGAGGLLGGRLLSVLTKEGNRKVIGLVRNQKPHIESNDSLEFIEVDVLDLVALEQAFEEGDTVIHCAAIVTYDSQHYDKMLKVNELGTANVVAAAMNNNVKKLIHISSVATLSQKNPGDMIDETNIWIDQPTASQYAISKFKAEQEVWRGFYEGLNATILNPSFILGCDDFSKSSLRIMNTVAYNNTFYPRGSNGFVDINDVTDAVLKVIEKDYCGQRFIISGANLSYENLYKLFIGGLGKKFKSRPLPRWTDNIIVFADFFRAMLPGKSRAIWKDTVNATKQQRVFDNKKSVEVLGMKYKPIEQTISEMAQEFLKVHKL